MDMNYTEAKNYIEKLRSEYCCKGDLVFRCAVQNVVEYGVVPLTENLAVEDWISDIDRRHDEAEAEGKILYIGRDFEKAIAECTFKLAKVGSMNLMMYIQILLTSSGESLTNRPRPTRTIVAPSAAAGT